MPVNLLTQTADSGARLAIRLLQDAAEIGDIDPWDVDVIPVIDGFLDQLKQRIEIPKKISKHFSQNGGSYEVDLAQSSEAFLAASVLVGLKAEVLEAEMFSFDVDVEEIKRRRESDEFAKLIAKDVESHEVYTFQSPEK